MSASVGSTPATCSGPDNRPAAGTWAGKPDVYHAFQATLVPRLPVWPPFAAALRARSRG